MPRPNDKDFDNWVARAKMVLIEDICAHRNIKLRRKGIHEQEGPCPLCGGDDRFSINTSKQVFNCRGCKRGGDVIEFIKFLDKCEFLPAVETLTGEPKPNGNNGSQHRNRHPIGRRQVEHLYAYHDSEGREVYANVRFHFKLADGSVEIDPERGKPFKTFRHWRADGRGGWLSEEGAMKGVEYVPYRLPNVLEAIANGQTIFIVEGEKKADLLWEWGVPATCNSGGTGYGPQQWPKLAKYFQGADCILLPDNDDSGRKHAGQVASALANHNVGVRILTLPGLPPRGDIIDWAAAGGSREALDELVGQAKPWSGSEATRPPGPAFTLSAFIWQEAINIQPRQWIFRRHYIRGHLTCTVGPGGFGKTTLSLAEAIAMASGTHFLGEPANERVKVWYWNGEDPVEEIERRIHAICQVNGVDGKKLEGWLFIDSGQQKPLKLAGMAAGNRVVLHADTIKALMEAIQIYKVDVIIIDPFISIHGIPENDNVSIDQVCKELARIASELGCCVEILHHVRKPGFQQKSLTSEDARGGSAIVNACRSSRIINRMNGEEATKFGIKEENRREYIRIDKDKANMAPAEVASWFHLSDVEIGNGDHVAGIKRWEPPKAMEEITTDDMWHVRREVGKKDYRLDMRSGDWVGGILIRHKKWKYDDKIDRAKANRIIKGWVATGVLKEVEKPDLVTRKMRKYVVAGDWNEGVSNGVEHYDDTEE